MNNFSKFLIVISVLFSLLTSAAASQKEQTLTTTGADTFFGNEIKWKKSGKIASVTESGGATFQLKLNGFKYSSITFYKNGIIRFYAGHNPMTQFGDTPAVIKLPEAAAGKLISSKKDFVISDDEKSVVIDKKSGDITVFKNGKRLFSVPGGKLNFTSDGFLKMTINWGKDVLFYGLGEKTGGLTKNGRTYKMWNTDAYGYHPKTDPLYESIPFFISAHDSAFTGLFLNNSYETFFDMAKSDPESAVIGAAGGDVDLFIFTGDNPADIVGGYTFLTGTHILPPLWAIGYQQCKFSYYPDSKVLEVADSFRKKNIPADVIYLDIDFMEKYQIFTHSKTNFPDPAGLIKKLHNSGFKVITMINPGVKADEKNDIYRVGREKGFFLKTPDGKESKGPVWPGVCVFPDFSRQDVVEWWGPLYKELVSFGIDGFWNDMNEPAVFNKTKTIALDTIHYDNGKKTGHLKNHNTYGLYMIKATYDGLEKLKPGNRNFILSRAGFAGVQRYGAVWTGDNTANWDHLRMNVTMNLNMGISGIAFNGADIGGYTGMPSGELYTRWMAVGSLFPLFRGHSERGNPDKEPWALGEQVEKDVRKIIELRYKLIRYLYDAMRKTSETGTPVTRPLFYDFPNDEKVLKIEDEFMFGDSILAAPVVTSGVVKRTVYLPSGTDWYDFYNGRKYKGGQTIEVDAPLDTIPLFVRDGGIIPISDVVQFIDAKNPAPVEIAVYGTKPGEYRLFDDDGETTGYKNGIFTERIFSVAQENGALSLKVTFGSKKYEKFSKIKRAVNISENGVKELNFQ